MRKITKTDNKGNKNLNFSKLNVILVPINTTKKSWLKYKVYYPDKIFINILSDWYNLYHFIFDVPVSENQNPKNRIFWNTSALKKYLIDIGTHTNKIKILKCIINEIHMQQLTPTSLQVLYRYTVTV